jgi:hypothetical protein
VPEPLDPAIEDALAFLRGHLSGVLRFDGEIRPIKIVIAPDGRLVASAMVAMIRSLDTTICLPDEEDESFHAQVTLTQFEERGADAALADRWRIYHGEPPDVRWASMFIDAARFNGLFIDGEALMVPNQLASSEPSICKALNAGQVDLVREACLKHAQVGIEKPTVVGVDPLGIDVRGAFDVVRLKVEKRIEGERGALDALRQLASAT